METIDAVADEPAVTVMSQDAVAQHQRAAEKAQPNSPQNSPAFNDMKNKLESAMKEFVPAVQAQPKEPAKAEAKADAKEAPAAEVKTDKASEAAKEPETITSAKAQDWKNLKADRDQWKTKFTELEQKHTAVAKEYETVKAKAISTDPNPELQKQIKALTEERDKIYSQLETVALERSERFNTPFQKKFESALARAREAAGEHAEKVEHLMNLQPSKWRKERIQELAEGLGDMDRAALAMAVTEYDTARATRDSELKNSRENIQRLRGLDAEVAKRDAELQEARTTAAIESIKDRARTREAFQVKDGDDAHNALVKANEMEIENFLRGKLSPDAIGELPIEAIEGRRLKTTVIPALQKKVEELEAAIKEYQAATPANGGAAGAKQPANRTANDAPLSMGDSPFIRDFKKHLTGVPG